MHFKEDDLDGFFEEFGVDAEFEGKLIKVIFDDEYEGVNPQTGEVESSRPQATVKSSDITDEVYADDTDAVHENTLKIGFQTYKIKKIQPDGTGVTLLELSKD